MLGATVQWAEKLKHKAPPIGVVTARNGRMVEIDGRGWWVSEGLIEEVGGMTDMDWKAIDRETTKAESRTVVTARDLLLAELEALQEIVAEQCAALAAAPDREEMEALREKAELWDLVPDMVADILSEVMGSSNPASLAGCPLPSVKALAELVRGE